MKQEQVQHKQEEYRTDRYGNIPKVHPVAAVIESDFHCKERQLGQENKLKCEISPEIPLILLPDACAEPWTVMVESCNTFLANCAVFGPQGLLIIAGSTVPQFEVDAACFLVSLLCRQWR